MGLLTGQGKYRFRLLGWLANLCTWVGAILSMGLLFYLVMLLLADGLSWRDVPAVIYAGLPLLLTGQVIHLMLDIRYSCARIAKALERQEDQDDPAALRDALRMDETLTRET